jgi:hypothetical protein
MLSVAGLRVAAAFGGLSKFEQVKDLKNGCEVRGKYNVRLFPVFYVFLSILYLQLQSAASNTQALKHLSTTIFSHTDTPCAHTDCCGHTRPPH